MYARLAAAPPCSAKPADLKGKRVGTTQYGATAILTIKGMLQDEYGVTPRDISWFIGGLNTPAEKPHLVTEKAPPPTDTAMAEVEETVRIAAEGFAPA